MRTAKTTVTGVAVSSWLPLDPYTDSLNDGLYLTPGAGATVGLEYTPDDVFDPAVTPVAFAAAAPFAPGVVAKVSGALPYAAKAVRINQTVGATTSTLQVVTKGLR